MNFEVRDIAQAPEGALKLEYAERHMGALLKVRERFEKEKPLEGLRIGLALHVTKETGVLVRTLRAGGAEIAICSCNPLSTQDDVAAALAQEGVKVFAIKGETQEQYYDFLARVIDFKPHITIDDGCDLISEIHKKHPELIPEILGGCEETTTGIIRLEAMQRDGELKYPVIAVNDNKTKHLFDNYYGTGQSTWDGILRATNALIAGKTVVVCGYGSCGQGVALRARGMGANVIVTEINHISALRAVMDGYRVMPVMEAAPLGDIFITVTGNKHVLDTPHFEKMKSGAILANSGHFNAEINTAALGNKKRTVRPFLEEYIIGGDATGNGGRDKTGGRALFLVAEGRLVNLAAAEGHPSEVMALSFCGQALACEYIVRNQLHKRTLSPGVHRLPAHIDNEIATLQMEAMNITIDTMTAEQSKYSQSWKEGT